MKKNYIAPCTVMTKVEVQQILAGSPGVNSTLGIGYGGVDTEGTMSGDSRYVNNLWDDDEDEW